MLGEIEDIELGPITDEGGTVEGDRDGGVLELDRETVGLELGD